ncbi:hypothetical protein BGZ49_001012 [Haplosporangium sp. Z 27]|nr:hypothetical protein BGZ49_001012 [Haplosporangium sp. Z 27]
MDLSRPCKRCISVGKDDTCRDVEHKKRGRPKLVDKTVAIDGTWSTKDGTAKNALAKTRVKGKYTKSVNYKMPKKTTTTTSDANTNMVSEDNFIAPQAIPSSRDSLDNQQSRSSSYPSHPELERPSSAMSYRSHQSSGQSYQGRPLSIHSEPPLPGDQDPFYYHNSTSQVKRPQEMYSAPSNAPLVTVFLTMDLVCARVSDESHVLWGYHPHDISHKSLYSIIASEDQSKMRNLLGLIKDAVLSSISPNSNQHISHFSFLESSSPVFYQNRPGIMSSSAPGSVEYTDVIRICHADGGSDLFSVRMYIGGGLGTDLLRGLNMEHAYVVCIMARDSPPLLNDHSRAHERLSLDESRSNLYSNTHSLSTSSDSQYPPKQPLPQQHYSPSEPASVAEESRKISLPPIFTGVNSSNMPSLSSPSRQSPLSSNSSNSRPMGFAPSAPSSSLSGLPQSYTVPLSKPSSHSTSLPSLRTGPLHTARWLYDSEPFGGSGHVGHSAPSSRLPTMFSDPFRSISAPMGGFGVSKYLNRSDPSPSFSHIKRHQLPLPSPLQSSQGPRSADAISRNPRSLQKDLSSSSFGASFASQSPPSCMKRSLADMADSQDRNRDIDNRHQDHHQHQSSRSGSSSSMLSSSLPAMSRAPYQQTVKLDIQSMPPDHPSIDPSSSGVCPIVHGSQQRERIQQAQMQSSLPSRELEMKDSQPHNAESERGACRWARLTDQWRDCRDNGPPGHDCFAPRAGSDPREQEYERGRERVSKEYYDYEGPSPARHHSRSPEGHRGYVSEVNQNGSVNPFSTGPSSPTESYSHYRSGSSLRRTSSVGRSSFISRNKGPVVCLTGACGAVCRCSGEDEETRAVKAMDAARKRMSVHSLLC